MSTAEHANASLSWAGTALNSGPVVGLVTAKPNSHTTTSRATAASKPTPTASDSGRIIFADAALGLGT